MKLFLFVMVSFISLGARAQECKIKTTTDAFTKETTLSSGFIQLDGGSVTIDANKQEIDILFSVEGVDKCFDNNSTAYIYFEGTKSKGSGRNAGTMNCEGLYHFIFKNSANTTSLLNRLMTQKVTHVVFTGSNKKETTVTFGPLEQEAFMKFANCIVAEAKTLLGK